MVMLCFVLDLRSLSPPLLGDLKQSLLQLANFYAICSPISERPHSKPLRDRIGLCYILNNRISCCSELKVAYTPRGNFSLRDFHHAVTNLPTDAFSPKSNSSGVVSCDDVKLPSVLSDEVLYSWIGHEKDITRKVILISSSLVENLDSVTKQALMDAADKCVSVEFVLLEQKSSHLSDLPININNFVTQINDLENCSFRTLLPDAKVLHALVKRWLQELKDDMEEQLQANFNFKRDFVGSLKQISCNLCPSYNQLIGEFTPCQTCRCHGMLLDDEHGNKIKRSSCPLTGNNLGPLDLIENSVKVGEQTILLMPSFRCCLKLQQVTLPVDFNVVERTNLRSLSEGVIFGPSYIVTPSSSPDSDDIDKSELNSQLFLGLCSALHSLDQGLVCSSNCNIETLKQTSFQCYYVLLPSVEGLMLLRRLAGSEEVLPYPDFNQFLDSKSAKDIENSIRTSLLKMEASDYNPLLHERGYHQKLNVFVKESLQFGSLPPKLEESSCEPNSTHQDFPQEAIPLLQQDTDMVIVEEDLRRLDSKGREDKTTDSIIEEWDQLVVNEIPEINCVEEAIPSKQDGDIIIIEEELPSLDPKAGEDQTTARITEEWEQLIVSENSKRYSPTCVAKPKFDQPILSLQESSYKHLDEKTSRILERLEIPRQLRKKIVSPVVSSSTATEVCVLVKKPLIPSEPRHVADQGIVASQLYSQPMKPNFQRLKRKLR